MAPSGVMPDYYAPRSMWGRIVGMSCVLTVKRPRRYGCVCLAVGCVQSRSTIRKVG